MFRQLMFILYHDKNESRYIIIRGIQKIRKLSKEYKKSEMRTINNSNLMKILIIAVVLCCLAQSAQTKYDHDQYLIVLKNDKISVLNYNPYVKSNHNKQNIIKQMWIYNDQQSITVELPLYKQEQQMQHYFSNHTQNLPLWNQLIQNKGYLKPYSPYNNKTNHMLKGYRYIKPAYQDTKVHQTYQQIHGFIKNLIRLNNLTPLNIRMEDTFTLTITILSQTTAITDYHLTGITVKYLFTTVTKDQLPQTLLKLQQSEAVKTDQLNTINHNEYARQNNFSTLERKLYGKGLHQSINHTITFDDLVDIELQTLANQCWYQFTDILPESTYIDSDQRRKQTTNYETINIEKPAFASKQYFYKYRVALAELQQSGIRKYSYHQPIHFRYPSASSLNYTKVYLHPIVDARIICKNTLENSQKSQQSNQIVYRVQQNLLYERGTANIPNGDISKAKIVSITTLVVCLVAVLVIIKNLKKN